MDDVKALVESRAFWSALVALLAAIAQAFHLQDLLSIVSNPHLIDAILSVVTVGGSVGAIIFRTVARKKIVSVLPKK